MSNSKKSDEKEEDKLVKGFMEEVGKFNQVVKSTNLISKNQQGIATSGRGVRAVQIFTKQTLTANSLMSLFPGRSTFTYLWDPGSISALARNIIECFMAIYFFGTEKISKEEEELRFFIFQYHRNSELYKINKVYTPDDPELSVFKNGNKEQLNRIKEHIFFKGLNRGQQKRIVNGAEMYKTKADFEQELPICQNLSAHFRYLSNLVHPVGISIYRIDNMSGRGLGSSTDISHCLRAVMLARRFQAASTVAIAEFFPDRFEKRLKPMINRLKELINEGFK